MSDGCFNTLPTVHVSLDAVEDVRLEEHLRKG